MLTPLAPVAGDTILPLETARTAVELTASDSHHDTKLLRARNYAISWAEKYTGVTTLARQYRWAPGGFTSSIRLPRWPLLSVDAIAYRDSSGAEASLVEADWYLAGDQVLAAYGRTWPVGDHVRVDFTAGHLTVDEIDEYLIGAITSATAAFFFNEQSPDLTGAMRCADLARVSVL